MRNVPISFLAAARRKPTGLDVCKNGCAGMHRGGPYWLPPRRAPFGRKENPPQAGVPPDSASPRSLVTVCEEARDSMLVARTTRFEPCDLPHPRGTCLAGYRMGTELQVVMAGAWIAVSGSAHGERRVSGVRRAAPLWWFFPDLRVSTYSIERCQLQRASRVASERGRFRASAQESSKRASPKRSRRLQSTPPPPQPPKSVPVC